ncbi:MAG: hypothetical protein IPJ90_10180 [Anaerolineaceae bacterium]|nr:hypothetical protein [Anaerolineaceae bacterium]
MILVPLLLFCSGIVMIGIGIHRYKGPISVWYIAYGSATVSYSYLGIPIGTSVMLLALLIPSFVPEEWKMLILILAIAVIILGLIFAPRLLKPAWLHWLEQEHGAILPMLRIEIQEMGPENWNRRINTQAELEEWIDEVKQQRKRRAMGIDD